MKKILIGLGVIVVVLFIVASWFLGAYNSMVIQNEQVTTSWAEVETQYQRRFDLIPNLVAATRGYLKQEQVASQESEVFYPEPTNYAVDSAGVLTPEQLLNLNKRLEGIDNGTRQYAVLIVKTTAPLSIEQYAIKLAEKWKVGHETLDNGAIIIIATKDRKVRIEVGYGLEQYIPDSVAGRIIDEKMISSLKTSDWYGAVLGAINGLEEKIK